MTTKILDFPVPPAVDTPELLADCLANRLFNRVHNPEHVLLSREDVKTLFVGVIRTAFRQKGIEP